MDITYKKTTNVHLLYCWSISNYIPNNITNQWGEINEKEKIFKLKKYPIEKIRHLNSSLGFR